jgi:hypothetical protein
MAQAQTTEVAQAQTTEVAQAQTTEVVGTKAFNVPVSEAFRDAVNAHIDGLSWECVTKGGIIMRPPSLRYFLTATVGPVVGYTPTDDDRTPGRTEVDPEAKATLDAVTKAVRKGLTAEQLEGLRKLGLA